MIKCLFLVEGAYDKQRLSLLENLFDSAKLEIISFGCDRLIGYEYYKNYGDHIKSVLSKEKTFEIDDFDYIVQVCDLDGCFIDDNYVIENKVIKKVKYHSSCVEAVDRDSIINRNHIKVENITRLLESKHIIMFYNATNIDHAFDGIQNAPDKVKRDGAINMYNKYKDNPLGFFEKLYNSNALRSKSYESSWDDAKKGFNSLIANSNLIFFVDMFKDYLKEDIRIEYEKLINS